MDGFVTRRKRKSSPLATGNDNGSAEESTDVKLAILCSLHPGIDQETLLDILLAHDGSVEATSVSLKVKPQQLSTKLGRPPVAGGSQSSLRSYALQQSSPSSTGNPKRTKLLSRKGATLHLFDPQDVSEHTPCTLIHNFLPPGDAKSLLVELLEESKTFSKITFKLFDNVVSSPHTSGFYVESDYELDQQRNEYIYNGARMTDVRKLTPQLDRVKNRVQEAVNREIQERIRTRYPGGQKLRYQSPAPWTPNAAFVNCYNGPDENVGWHSDQLTYLGPRAVIGSLSLGVTREFRVRRVLPRDTINNSAAVAAASRSATTRTETKETVAVLLDEETEPRAKEQQRQNQDEDQNEGQISIHLPHNSLLIMHADMQEEWKHSVSPTQTISPHPISGARRINITYRHYRPEFHPHRTPRCSGCDVPCVLRVVQRKTANRGRYFWMCYAGNVPGKNGCDFFKWAEFDEDGSPLNT